MKSIQKRGKKKSTYRHTHKKNMTLESRRVNSTELISYPDLPRPREREISLFSLKQSEIWARD